MPGLTADQIALGKGGKPLPAPGAIPGRWRCLLCPKPVWRKGTDRDGHLHYLTYHFIAEG